MTKESPRTMALASSLGFFPAADRVTQEGRAALQAAAAAAAVNEAAVRGMGRLQTLGELAREDDEVGAPPERARERRRRKRERKRCSR